MVLPALIVLLWDAQASHTEERPVVLEYVPLSHMTHVACPGPAAYVPAPQLSQVLRPDDAWYLPAMQSMHDGAPTYSSAISLSY